MSLASYSTNKDLNVTIDGVQIDDGLSGYAIPFAIRTIMTDIAGSGLSDIDGLTPTDGVIIVGDGTNWVAESGATARASLGVAIGTDVQGYDAGLASIAGLSTAADKMIYTTASDTYATADLTSFARTLLDDTTAAAAATTLGLGTGDNVTHTNITASGTLSATGLTTLSSDVDIKAATTETRTLSIGKGRTGDGISRIRIIGDTTYSAWGFQFLRDPGANGSSKLDHRGTGNIEIGAVDAGGITFKSSNAEKARMDTSGNFLFGKTSSALGTAGVEIYNQGRVDITDASNALLFINRLTDDGNLVQFYQDGTLEGAISVSGTTVTYGNFLGSHYSECENPTEFLPGTIVESTGELVSDRFTSSERLVKFKVATKGSKAVYGTILGPSIEDDIEDENGNKIPQGEGRNPVRTQYLVAGLGAYQVRMKKGQKPSVGDLVESAGGGVGAVQKDDIVRSKTVAKITGSHSVATYEDGSTVWPAVIMCG